MIMVWKDASTSAARGLRRAAGSEAKVDTLGEPPAAEVDEALADSSGRRHSPPLIVASILESHALARSSASSGLRAESPSVPR